MGYYVSVEPGTDDKVVGNPQLQLSRVMSGDLRAEYTWGDYGDLAAISGFYKEIDNPIESIAVRDASNREGGSGGVFRTFFNNPNQATLLGVELEGRKNLGFTGPEIFEYFSVGGNFTYIKAEVDRSQIELDRARPYFGTAAGDVERFAGLQKSRRLFGQPEWIVNADLTFDQEDWGTKVTLSVFAISSILDAAGSATLQPDGRTPLSLTIDRYVDSFHQLDLVISQSWYVDLLQGDVTLKASIKNLTDSTRRIIYDQEQTTNRIPERSYKIGRDYAFSLSYSF
jgi:outer membrane receptor protein involved in Fe transport